MTNETIKYNVLSHKKVYISKISERLIQNYDSHCELNSFIFIQIIMLDT